METRETSEGWPLLSVETEVNGDSKRVQMKGVFPWLVHWACRVDTIDFCSALAVLVGLVKNIFSSPSTISIPCAPIAQQAGQAAVLGRLSFSMCLG